MATNDIKAQLIKEFMIKNKLSEDEFCKLCKINIEIYRKIMSKDYNFSFSIVFKIAKILNIEVGELFEK